MKGIAALLALVFISSAHADYSHHPRVPDLLNKLRLEYGFTEVELAGVTAALAKAEQVPSLIEAEQKAKEKTLTWDAYRPIHVMETNRRNGLRFLAENSVWLARAEAQWGVPATIIAAILGVETKYGTQPGRNRVLDALATQGFDHPTRSAFFFGELAEFFVLCRDLGLSPTEVKGSYAGAMGAAQFMPSNYRRLAVDFDGDGNRNLWQIPDAIGSVANYLVNYKPEKAWQRGQPLAVLARLKKPPKEEWPVNAKMYTHRLADFLDVGVKPAVALPPDTPVGLLDLVLRDDGHEYWLGFNNFYSVMSYNPRVYYAMAVMQLAAELQKAQAASAVATAR